jgi:integrase
MAGPPNPWPRDKNGKPLRRLRVPGARNQNLYWRRTGSLEVGYRDSTGRQRWRGPFDTITQARAERDAILGAKGRGERVQPSPRLTFGVAYNRWLDEYVAGLRARTRDGYQGYAETHLLPRWHVRRLDTIDRGEVARLVREMRAAGYAEWTIESAVRVAGYVFRFAGEECGWHGMNPLALLTSSQRPKIAETPERRIYTDHELEQVLGAADEPWLTLFRLADMIAGRESELLGLWWEDLGLGDLERATIRFGFQVDRSGNRVPLKTDESKAVLPLPRAAAVMLLEHRARSLHTGPRAYVFATKSGRPLGQRNVLRALYRAQERARKPDGTPTFEELFEHDEHGHLVLDERGECVLRNVKRRELDLPHFHALRHGAAMACEDLEEARDLLRHKNSTVTAIVYRAHFSDRRREQLRGRLEARHGSFMEATDRRNPQPTATRATAEVVDLQRIHQTAS